MSFLSFFLALKICSENQDVIQYTICVLILTASNQITANKKI